MTDATKNGKEINWINNGSWFNKSQLKSIVKIGFRLLIAKALVTDMRYIASTHKILENPNINIPLSRSHPITFSAVCMLNGSFRKYININKKGIVSRCRKKSAVSVEAIFLTCC